ncbi:cyclin-T [Brachionus plicatilis]|uniref:Cyclin-T n=1 Tax=Brachionus plicatilis TaxID=10195 RepID=A0A3M7PZX4_BRAPC|nr:cyclin-T [Brachionus plicatilis]
MNKFKKSKNYSLPNFEYKRYEEEIVKLESCALQTLGFDVLINHAHTFIIKTCQMIKAPRDLAEAAYFTATNSLILTNFCVRFSSEKIACFCIFLACKGTDLIIPTSTEGLQWYQYVKHDIVEQELEGRLNISKDYLTIYQKCSPMVQKKIGKPKSAEQQAQNPLYKQPQVKKPYPPQMNPHHVLHKNKNKIKVEKEKDTVIYRNPPGPEGKIIHLDIISSDLAVVNLTFIMAIFVPFLKP